MQTQGTSFEQLSQNIGKSAKWCRCVYHSFSSAEKNFGSVKNKLLQGTLSPPRAVSASPQANPKHNFLHPQGNLLFQLARKALIADPKQIEQLAWGCEAGVWLLIFVRKRAKIHFWAFEFGIKISQQKSYVVFLISVSSGKTDIFISYSSDSRNSLAPLKAKPRGAVSNDRVRAKSSE